MAKLNLTLPVGEVAVTGKQVTFASPCDSEGLTHIVIKDDEFELVDASGSNLVAGAFASGAMVSFILNVESRKAYIQNADINHKHKESFLPKTTRLVNSVMGTVHSVPENSAQFATLGKFGGAVTQENCFLSVRQEPWGDVDEDGWVIKQDSENPSILNVSCGGVAGSYMSWFTELYLPATLYTISVETDGVPVSSVTVDKADTIKEGGNYCTFTPYGDDPARLSIHFSRGNSAYPNSTVKIMLVEGGQPMPYSNSSSSQVVKVTEIESKGINLFDIDNPVIVAKSAYDHNRYLPKIENGVIYSGGKHASSNGGGFLFDVRGISTLYISYDTEYNLATETARYMEVRKVTDYSGTSIVTAGASSLPILGSSSVPTPNYKAYVNVADCDHVYISWYSTNQYGLAITNLMVSAFNVPYQPYLKETIKIPAEVQSLPSYSVCLSTFQNEVDFEGKKYTQRVVHSKLSSSGWQNQGSYYQINLSQLGLPNASVAQRAISLLSGYAYGDSTTDKSWWIDGSGTGIRVRDDHYMYGYDEDEGFSAFKNDISSSFITYVMATPVEFDISKLLVDSPHIQVVPNGTVTFVCNADVDVPTEVSFYPADGALTTATVVGDVIGTALRAIYDENGNPITSSYSRSSRVVVDSEAVGTKQVPDQAVFARIKKLGGKTVIARNFITHDSFSISANKPPLDYGVDDDGVTIYCVDDTYTGSMFYCQIPYLFAGGEQLTLSVQYAGSGEIIIERCSDANQDFEELTTEYFDFDKTAGSYTFYIPDYGYMYYRITIKFYLYHDSVAMGSLDSCHVYGAVLYKGNEGVVNPAEFNLETEENYVQSIVSTNGSTVVDSIITRPPVDLPNTGYSVDDTLCNYIDFEKKQYVQQVGYTYFRLEELSPFQVETSYGGYNLLFKKTISNMKKSGARVLCNYFTETTSTDIPKGCVYVATNHFGDRAITFNLPYSYGHEDSYYDSSSKLSEMPAIEVYYTLETPIITDISEWLTDDLIEVVKGGSLLMDASAPSYNGTDIVDVPNTIEWLIGKNSTVISDTFVGNLEGVAKSATNDSNGNKIADTYALAPVLSKTDISAGVTKLAEGQSYHVYE